MTLKNKISFLISAIFTVLYLVASMIVYFAFSDFREEEFENRLMQKALSTVKLLAEVDEVDKALLKKIEQNSIDKLYDVKTLIFDANYKLIYSNLDDTRISWAVDDLDYLKEQKSFFEKQGDVEIYGYHYDTQGKNYYVFVSAQDHSGHRKLRYLVYLLIITYVIFTTIFLFVILFIVKKLFRPLDIFHAQIKIINENNLDTRIAVKKRKDEIDLLANEFNEMLQRIDNSYQKQKEFTSHASHELRTPITRMTSQIENKISDLEINDPNRSFLSKLMTDVNQLSELISSLLLLSRLENVRQYTENIERIDEIIYEAIAMTKKIYPEFKISFDMEDSENMESLLKIKGNESLLKIAFANLLKNACVYSDNSQAKIAIFEKEGLLNIAIENNGTVLTETEQHKLFEPFMRGNNSQKKSGLGLGLRIVKRILNQHNAQIVYTSLSSDKNLFTVIFR
ncbi:MAG: ATP-binding protein [Flavobacterium sp.]